MIKSLNEWLFLAINGSHASPEIIIIFALGLAEYVVPLIGLAMAVVWIRGPFARRRVVLEAGLAGLLGLAMVQVIAALWYVPRPFQIGLGTQLMAHVPEASFPSDHATLMFSLSLTALRAPAMRKWGVFGFAVALAVSWARVFLGVHFPLDIAGGLLVAGLAVWLVGLMTDAMSIRMTAIAERMYASVLRWTRLPESVFPRP